jgi:hypothetical protein
VAKTVLRASSYCLCAGMLMAAFSSTLVPAALKNKGAKIKRRDRVRNRCGRAPTQNANMDCIGMHAPSPSPIASRVPTQCFANFLVVILLVGSCALGIEWFYVGAVVLIGGKNSGSIGPSDAAL